MADRAARTRHSHRSLLIGAVVAAVVALALAGLSRECRAGQSLFWLQENGTVSELGAVQNPDIEVLKNHSIQLYVWLDKDSVSYGFDGISLDARLTSADGGAAVATLAFDEPAGRWDGTTGGDVRTDSGGSGVDNANAIDLTNTDTLTPDPARLAVLTITGITPGTVKLNLCVGEFGIADGGSNAVVWFGLGTNSTVADTQIISGGVPGLCSTIPEATLHVTGDSYRGDFDGDLDVDQEDFAHLQLCLAGSTVPQSDPACDDANLNGDPFVDAADADLFEACFSGPGVTPPINCQQ